MEREFEGKKLLMLGTSKGTIEMLKIAKAKGIHTIVTDYLEPEKSIAKLVSDEYWMINTNDLDALEKKCREEKVDGVVSGVSEFNLEMTMELTKRLGLPSYCTPEAWHYSRNKNDFKQLCKKLNVRVAEDYPMSNPPTEEELNNVKFPVVVKAINMSANRGMSYCYNKEELVEACAYARKVSGSDTIIVERMLKGPEVSADYVMGDGKIRLISVNTMNNQPGELQNCYSITTTENRFVRKFIQEENPDVIKAFEAVGCREGFGWIETIYDEDGHFYILEMGYRLCGNEINIPLKNVAGVDALEWVIDYAMGKKHTEADLPAMQSDYYDRCGCAYCLWSDREGTIGQFKGIDEIINDERFYWDTVMTEGTHVGKHVIMGVIAFDAADAEDMCSIINEINEKVSVLDSNGEDMMIHFTDCDQLIQNSRKYAL